MDSCELNTKEITCIAAWLGATELYGIPDAFKGITDSKLSNEILSVHMSLEKKGYIKENFDGESKLNNDIVNIVDVCAHCEKFIAIDKQVKHKIQEGILIYVKGTLAVIADKNVDIYKMRILDTASIFSNVLNIIEWKSDSNDQFKYRISNKSLLKAKQLKIRKAEDAAIRELLNENISENIAKVILNGYGGNEDFYSFTFVNLKSDDNNVDNVMYFFTDKQIVRLTSVMEDIEDFVYLQNATKVGVETELKKKYDNLEISNGVFE